MPHPLFEKAQASWRLGVELRDRGQFNAAANRLYYGLFQAVRAHFASEPEMARADGIHGRVKAKLRYAEKDTFEGLRELREKADYQPDDVQAEDLSDELIERANRLLKSYLNRGKP